MDVKFKVLRDRNFAGVSMNISSESKHTTKMERFHKVIQETCVCYCAMVQFASILWIMLVQIAKTATLYISAPAQNKGLSHTLSPLAIIEGETLDFSLHFRMIFGEFLKTYEVIDSTIKK